MNIIINGPSLYISGSKLNIEYNINDPYDIRIRQPEKAEIGTVFIICSVLLLIVLWIVRIIQLFL